MVDIVIYYTGVLGWIFFGLYTLNSLADWIIHIIIMNLWSKKEFMAFVWDRLRQQKNNQLERGE